MSAKLEKALSLYSIMTRKLSLYDDWLEVENVLLWRDLIHEGVESGEVLTKEQLRILEEADNRLLGERDRLIREFPLAFENTESTSPRQWWWHMPEGPDVRDRAREAA